MQGFRAAVHHELQLHSIQLLRAHVIKLITVYNLCTATLTDLPAAISGQDEYLYANLGSQIYEGYHFSTTFKETPSASVDSLAPKDSSLQK